MMIVGNQKPLIGGHVSSAGGLYRAIENAREIGAATIQIFGASPQQWRATLPSLEEIKKYQDYFKKGEVQSVYLHGAYLVNLASPDDGLRDRSVDNLSAHLKIATMMGAVGVIFHVGSGKDSDKTAGIQKAINGMKEVLKNVPGKTQLIMENSASGKKIGARPEEMAEMLEGVNSARIKICLDTAHAFEAGLIEKYTSENIKVFLDQWEEAVGLETLVALHVNDSKTPWQSNFDRHENIGEGHIGLEGFRNLAKEKRLWDKAWLLEVPGFDNHGPDKKNIEILKSLF